MLTLARSLGDFMPSGHQPKFSPSGGAPATKQSRGGSGVHRRIGSSRRWSKFQNSAETDSCRSHAERAFGRDRRSRWSSAILDSEQPIALDCTEVRDSDLHVSRMNGDGPV